MFRDDFRFQIGFHVQFNLRWFWTRTNLGEVKDVRSFRCRRGSEGSREDYASQQAQRDLLTQNGRSFASVESARKDHERVKLLSRCSSEQNDRLLNTDSFKDTIRRTTLSLLILLQRLLDELQLR